MNVFNVERDGCLYPCCGEEAEGKLSAWKTVTAMRWDEMRRLEEFPEV